jgi:RimJ/RimL family protein N-acetyltransferase
MTTIPPLLRDFPDHFETQRLLIRAPRPGDGKAINEAVHESLTELQAWMPWAYDEQTVEYSESYARRFAAKFALREDLAMLMFRKSDGQLVGGTGLHRIDWSIPKFEIGYWLRTSVHGQGYMTEAVNGLTRFAFGTLDAERVEIRCDERNEKSAAVARRAGYTQEGMLRHDARGTQDELRNTLIFGMIRSEYRL